MSDRSRLTDDPDVHLLVDGERHAPRTVTENLLTFDLPAAARSITIASRSVVPAEVAPTTDVRRLGVPVSRLVFTAPGVRAEISTAHAALADGWHDAEGPVRWTNGAGAVAPAIFGWIGQAFELELLIQRSGLRYKLGPPRALLAAADDGAEALLRDAGFDVTILPDPAARAEYLDGNGSALDLFVLPRDVDAMAGTPLASGTAPRAVHLAAPGTSEDRPPSLPLVIPPRQRAVPGPTTRQGLVLLNADAAAVGEVESFVTEVLPFARMLIPGLRLHLAGGDPSLARFGSDAVAVDDPAACTAAALDPRRILIAPAVLGASGIHGVVQGLSNGVPAVVAPALAAALGLAHEREVLVADGAAPFAMAIARLEGDRALWRSLSEAGRVWTAENCSLARGRQRFRDILTALGRADLLAPAHGSGGPA